MLKRGFVIAAILAPAVIGAAIITPLSGDTMIVATATTLRADAGLASGAVAPLKVGEAVRVWASTYTTVREETVEGGETYITERYELWYRVKTADGYEGWVPAAALAWPPEHKTAP